TEESCAFGVHGIAYFVAGASKVIDGNPHHDKGTTRIYISYDSGTTWKLGIETGWLDYTTSIVETSPGPNQNRLYVFFNDLRTFHVSLDNEDAVEADKKESPGIRVGLISYKSGDARIIGPFTTSKMVQLSGQFPSGGQFPRSAFRLKDGSLLTFFRFRLQRPVGGNERADSVWAIRTNDKRSVLEEPVRLLSTPLEPTPGLKGECNSGRGINYATAYDSQRDRLYLVYPMYQLGECRLVLINSIDGGKRWSPPRTVHGPGFEPSRVYEKLALAVNNSGVLAFLWQSRDSSWMFAASADGGHTLSAAKRLSVTSESLSRNQITNDNYLSTYVWPKGWYSASDATYISLVNNVNRFYRNAYGIGVASDGTFHPVWTEPDAGEGQLRISTVRVITPEESAAISIRELTDVTAQVAFLYGGKQNYDPSTGTITVDFKIKNNSANPIRGPFRVLISGLSSRIKNSSVQKSKNAITRSGQVIDVSTFITDRILQPGAESRAFKLVFHYPEDVNNRPPDLNLEGGMILHASLRLYATRSTR
ncbi:MAG: hypothetical protein ACRD8U_16740, partial [Pyrinomonadaceae bacterium]